MRDVVRSGVVWAAALRAGSTPRPDQPAASDGRPHRILLVRPDHLGDVLLTTPAIAALRAALPRAHLTALVGPWGAPALATNPDLDEVIPLPFPGFDRSVPPAGLHAYTLLLAAARALQRHHYDLALNLRPDFWWGAALLARARIPRRVGFDLPPGRHALTDRLPAPRPADHAAVRSLRLVGEAARVLGADLALPDPITPERAPLVYSPMAADRDWADAWLTTAGLAPDRPPIVLHPGSGAPIKAWPPHRWAAALTALWNATAASIVVTGSPRERPQVEAVLRLLPPEVHALAMTETVSVGQLAALLERARLALGVDSGPLHLATAVGTPTVRLYGPTSPAVFSPWGPAAVHVALASTLACAPCGRLDYTSADLPFHPCLRLIAPDAVVAAAQAVLASSPAAPAARVRQSPPIRRPAYSREGLVVP